MLPTMTMRARWIAAGMLALALALAPALAEAKAGGGASMGSRGARTYGFNGAAPIERSMTPPPVSRPSAAPPAAPYGAPGMAPGFGQRHPFMTGLLGGFVGAGIGSMLFGHGGGFMGGGYGFSGFLGLLLQLAVIAGLVYLVVGLFRRSSAYATAGGPSMGYAPGPAPSPAGGMREEVAIGSADLDQFGRTLVSIQSAWSRADLGEMRRYVTPEMLGYFSEQLSDLASRGLENQIQNVVLLKGDVVESWDEGHAQFCTVRMRWKSVDVTVRRDTAVIVQGDPQRPVETTETWTFVRARGGSWILSAIQQG